MTLFLCVHMYTTHYCVYIYGHKYDNAVAETQKASASSKPPASVVNVNCQTWRCKIITHTLVVDVDVVLPRRWRNPALCANNRTHIARQLCVLACVAPISLVAANCLPVLPSARYRKLEFDFGPNLRGDFSCVRGSCWAIEFRPPLRSVCRHVFEYRAR